jgi:hypothetical protein
MIDITCPSCGRSHESSETLAGLVVVCKGCSNRLQLPPRSTASSIQTDPPRSQTIPTAGAGTVDRRDSFQPALPAKRVEPPRDRAIAAELLPSSAGATSGAPGQEQAASAGIGDLNERYHSARSSLAGDQPAVKAGIGGWLILPAIGLVLGLISTVWAVGQDFLLFGSRIATYPGVYSALIGETVLNCGYLLFLGYVAFAFFSHKRTAPTLMIALYLASLLVSILDCLIVASVMEPSPQAVSKPVRAAMVAAVWIPYFLRSRRVEATFVN